MPGTITLYNHLPQLFGDAALDWVADTINLALFTSGYVASATHTQLADASASELAAGDGYTAGGIALASKTLVQDTGIVWRFSADDVTFNFTGSKTFRYGILYKSGTVIGLTDPLIAYILFDNTPADIVTSTDYFIPWHPNGIFVMG